MWKTLIVGNILYAVSVGICWGLANGDNDKFKAGLIVCSVAFGGGIVTGIVANTPKPIKRKRKFYSQGTASTTSDVFDLIE